MKNKIFIDDSGSKDFINPFVSDQIDNPSPFDAQNFNFWNNNYFVLCAVKIKTEDLSKIDRTFDELKIKYFKTKNVEIKSVWLRNPRQRKNHYIDKFGLEEHALNHFGKEYKNLIWKFADKIRIISVVFDKRYFKHRNLPLNDPLIRTSQVVFERIHRETKTGEINEVIFDQMENDIRIKKGRQGQIIDVLSQNKEVKTIYIPRYNISKLSFETSSKSNFLQIADMCAYTVNRQFMEHGREWATKEPGKTLELYSYFKKILCNFCRSNIGQVRGYGICLIPDKGKNNWNFSAGCEHKKSPH